MSIPPPPGPHQPQDPCRPPAPAGRGSHVPPYPEQGSHVPPYPEQGSHVPPSPEPGSHVPPYPEPGGASPRPAGRGPYTQPGGAHGLPLPYRPWTQGYRPHNLPAPVSGLAIASLVLGVLCFLPGVGLVLGLVALHRIRRRGERGEGLAVGGAVLSGIGLLLWALLFATGGAAGFWQGVRDGARDRASVSPARGECFDDPGGSLSGETYDLDTVPCAGEHDGEVFASFELTGGRYPGEGTVTRVADERCRGLRDGYAMDAWAVPADVDVYYLTPTAHSWAAGDHEVTCVFGSTTEGGDLTGSLRNDETVLDADQVAYLKAAHLLNAALDTVPDAEYEEDDLPGHKAWAGRVSAALAGQARTLRAHEWPARARGPVTALTARLDKARAQWARAAAAGNADAFYERYGTAVKLVEPRQAVTARKALRLVTAPPTRGDDGADTSMRV
ncbi:DUF4190 domain-containing protein [Streptomyces sp. NPDC048514]|uniref:DUF4190 domain-containing protein n=1 Tax=Streptomyces sp. NPDC048514 TaxID=3365564 RepID=UPI00371013D3